ncbi:MAG: hypothetical protein IH867_10095 [Chloroflexi bacterium]|nr:hypothetical protein [Chloroflexota bacterium]
MKKISLPRSECSKQAIFFDLELDFRQSIIDQFEQFESTDLLTPAWQFIDCKGELFRAAFSPYLERDRRSRDEHIIW